VSHQKWPQSVREKDGRVGIEPATT
jgi:hypothetical protein